MIMKSGEENPSSLPKLVSRTSGKRAELTLKQSIHCVHRQDKIVGCYGSFPGFPWLVPDVKIQRPSQIRYFSLRGAGRKEA